MVQFPRNRTVKIVCIGLAALLLLLAVWLVFFRTDGAETHALSEREARLVRILGEVEGVKEVTAMVTEEDGKPVCAVVVFAGADSILTRLRVLDITAAALGIGKANVQVYPAEG